MVLIKDEIACSPWRIYSFPAECKKIAGKSPETGFLGEAVLDSCASSQRGRSGLGCARPASSPMLRQLTLVPYSKVWLGFRSSLPQKRKVGPGFARAFPFLQCCANSALEPSSGIKSEFLDEIACFPWRIYSFPAECKKIAGKSPEIGFFGEAVLDSCASSQRGRSGFGCARPSPYSPMLRQLALENKNAVQLHNFHRKRYCF